MVPNPIIRIGHNINIHSHPKHVQSQSDSSYGSYGSLLYVDDEQTTTTKQQQLNKTKQNHEKVQSKLSRQRSTTRG